MGGLLFAFRAGRNFALCVVSKYASYVERRFALSVVLAELSGFTSAKDKGSRGNSGLPNQESAFLGVNHEVIMNLDAANGVFHIRYGCRE